MIRLAAATRLVIFFLLSGGAIPAISQGILSGYPFEVPADPRSFAMGESFTGVPANPSALMYNPAGLAGLRGVSASYSQRGYSSSNLTLRSYSAALGTSFGTFALQYNRDSYGVLPEVRTEQDPPSVNTYDYDIAFGYALGLGRGFAIGAAIKWYDYAGNYSDPWYGGILALSTKPATLFDIGFSWILPRFHSQDVVTDSLSIGLSYQNIGSAWNKKYLGLHTEVVRDYGPPQYFRMGMSYALRVMPRNEGDVSPFQAVISGESRSGMSGGGENSYGLGAEITIEEVFSVRLGGSFLGAEETPIRYGAAVRLPVPSLGFDISFQGAVIPWRAVSALSIEIHTTGPLF